MLKSTRRIECGSCPVDSMKKNARISNLKSSPCSSLKHDRHLTKVGDSGDRVKDGGDSGTSECVPSIDELWDMAEEKFPGNMMALYDEFLAELGSLGERRSLLKEIRSPGDFKLDEISEQLTKATLNDYTPHFSSMFLAHFATSKRTTHSWFRSLDHKYMRLGEIDGEGKDQGFDAKLHDVKNSFTSSKSVQLVLLFSRLLGRSIGGVSGFVLRFTDADSEVSCMRNIFGPAADIINNLFRFTDSFGFTVKADFEVATLKGSGRPDFAVTVDTLYKGNRTPTTECVSLVEFKSPNSGLWISWGQLTGQNWTEDEEAAFFELKKLKLKFDDNVRNGTEKLPSSLRKGKEKLLSSLRKGEKKLLRKKKRKLSQSMQNETEELLSSWQKKPLWDSAKRVLDRIGSNRVRVEYRNTEKKSGYTKREASDGLTGSPCAQDSKRVKLDELTPFYFIETADGKREDITALLDAAEFKTSFDSCHAALAQGTSYAVLNKCNRVAISDGLTVIAGSLKKLEKTEGFPNPTDSDDVLDAHFYSKYMMQTHDQDSLVHIVNYFTEGVMLRSDSRRLGHQLLSFSDPKGHDNDPITAVDELYMKMREHKLDFSPENPGVQFPAWEESLVALTKGAREAVGVALADFEDTFPHLKRKMDCIAPDSFDVVEWYRRDMYEGFESDEPLTPGRSNSVARVQLHDDKRGTHFVLKEYYPDQDSVARMKRELEAYCRISKLSDDERMKHVADLVSFGSLDLDEVPRLFLMLEYVEGLETDTAAVYQSLISAEFRRVDRLLESVGVDHNDLEDRNYRLQLDSDGNWYIKVFDFDHARYF